MFGFNKKDPVSPFAKLPIAFHKEARHFGEHGKLRVSHRKQNIDDQIITFVFPDTVTPPPMTPSLIDYIWDSAAAQGYIVANLVEYGRDRETVQFGSRAAPLSEERATAIASSMQRIIGGEVEAIARSMKIAADQVSDFDGDEINHPAPIAFNRFPTLTPASGGRKEMHAAHKDQMRSSVAGLSSIGRGDAIPGNTRPVAQTANAAVVSGAKQDLVSGEVDLAEIAVEGHALTAYRAEGKSAIG